MSRSAELGKVSLFFELGLITKEEALRMLNISSNEQLPLFEELDDEN